MEITAQKWRLDTAGVPTANGAAATVTDPQWIDVLNDTGSGSVSLGLEDSFLSGLGYDGLDLIQFLIDGTPAWVLYLDPAEYLGLQSGDEQAEVVNLRGRGHLALLSRGLVYPTGGVGRRPKETTRFFNWTALGYDDTGWAVAKTILLASFAKVTWPIPWDQNFPWDASVIIWADNPGGNPSTYLDADAGHCWFRKPLTIVTDGLYRVYFATDDTGEFYIDGQLVVTSDTFVATSWADITLTAGAHVIAVHGENADPNGNPNNPGGVAWVIFRHLSSPVPEFIDASDGTELVTAYVDAPPTATVGTALLAALAEWAARGGMTFAVDFTEVLDSNGDAWDTDADIATAVGRSLEEFVHELAETYIDVVMDPDFVGATVKLHAYNTGALGAATGLTYAAGVNIASLDAQRENVPVTALLLDTTDYWLGRDDAGGVVAYGVSEALFSLGDPASDAEIYRVADAQLGVYATPREQIDVAVQPAADGSDSPYPAITVGDRATVPDSTGTPSVERLVAVTVTQDAVGEAMFDLTFRTLVLTPEERLAISVTRGT